jgi:predicted aconitase with swiveling domain
MCHIGLLGDSSHSPLTQSLNKSIEFTNIVVRQNGGTCLRFKTKVIQGWEGQIKGELLVTKMKISFFGDIDQKTGEVVGADLDILGENIADKIFVFSEGRGSTVGSNVLYGLARYGFAPKLIVTERTELITISGAIYGEIPMVSSLPAEAFNFLKTGAFTMAYIIDEFAYLEV